jgi:alpha-N-arabinofuranosidase
MTRTRSFLPALAAAAIALTVSAPAAAKIEGRAVIDARAPGTRIAPEVYGQFAEHLGTGIEGGIWVGEASPIPNIRGYRRDVVEALQRLKVPVVRWPGGCFADIYRWRDGLGPRAQRPVTLNKWWGNTEESNQFGTHEFFDFAELIGAKTYLNVNVGTGSPGEARDWVEYVGSASNSRLAQERRANGRKDPWTIDYIGIGNEMWGCGGNLRVEEFSPMLRLFATFLKEDKGPKLIAGGPTGDDYRWTEVLMDSSRAQIDAISLHYYTLPTGDWTTKGPAVGFDERAWAATFVRTRRLEEMIRGHDARMDKHDPANKLGLMVAEWGTWYDVTPGTNSAFLQQENTLRDALVAATNFHIFHRNAERVHMANIAQMVNVLQAMILTDGPRMALTPTYHAFALYQPFQGAQALRVNVTSPDYGSGDTRIPALDVTAARDAAGAVQIGIVNVDPKQEAEVDLELAGVPGRGIEGQVLTAPSMDSRNSLGARPAVVPAPFKAARWSGGKLRVTVPAKSVVRLTIR